MRAHEPNRAVDDEELTVVAQVGAAPATVQRVDRHHRVLFDADSRHTFRELFIAGVSDGADVAEQQAHLHTALDSVGEGGEEDCRSSYPRP